MQSILAKSIIPFVITGLLSVTICLRSIAVSHYQDTVIDDGRYYLPPSSWMRVFSLGYNEAMADFIWVKTVMYFGEQMKKRNTQDATGFVMNYLLNAVDLDRKFRTLYSIGSTLTMYQNGGKISRRSLEMAIELLERGIQAFPNDGELYFSLGFIHHYEMLNFISGDPEDPVTKEHLRLGRYYFGKAALMDNAPPYAGLLSTSLMQKWDASEMVIAHLKAMLVKETDPNMRAQLIEKLRAEAGKTAERDIEKTDRLAREWQRELPFVPYDFYLILKYDAPVAELLNPLHLTDQVLMWNKVDEEDNSHVPASSTQPDMDTGDVDGRP